MFLHLTSRQITGKRDPNVNCGSLCRKLIGQALSDLLAPCTLFGVHYRRSGVLLSTTIKNKKNRRKKEEKKMREGERETHRQTDRDRDRNRETVTEI